MFFYCNLRSTAPFSHKGITRQCILGMCHETAISFLTSNLRVFSLMLTCSVGIRRSVGSVFTKFLIHEPPRFRLLLPPCLSLISLFKPSPQSHLYPRSDQNQPISKYTSRCCDPPELFVRITFDREVLLLSS